MSDTTLVDHPAGRKTMRRVVAASVVGTALETYDLYLYGTASALVFAPLFFPQISPTAGTLASMSTFAVSFIARPLGAAVFGHYGDRLGRKKMLYITYLMMGISTALIGFLPTFEQIGLAAPILLVVFRFLQGFGFGGEYNGAVLLLTEYAPPEKRGFYAGLNNLGPVAGFIGSSGLFMIMNLALSEADFMAWGWRVPFIVSLILVAVGIWLRSRVEETPVFKKMLEQPRDTTRRAPLVEVLRSHRKELVLATGMNISQFAIFYLFSVFTLSYGVSELGMERTVILSAVMLAMLINLAAIPFASALSDRIGRKPVLLIGFGITIIWAFPLFALLNTKNFVVIVLALMVYMVGYSFVYGPVASYMSELFPTHVRFTGSAIAYNLAGILGASAAPIIATLLLAQFQSSAGISLYIIGITLVSAISVLATRETRKLDLSADYTTDTAKK